MIVNVSPKVTLNVSSIFQIGDIHYSTLINPKQKQAENYDPKLSPQVFSGTAPLASVVLMSSLQDEIKKMPGSIVAFCGDYTTKGNIEYLNKAARYIADIITPIDKAILPDDNVHLVPGNHDVSQRHMPYTGLSPERFNYLSNLFRRAGVNPPLTTQVDYTTHHSAAGSILFASVNSCLARGATRYAPELELPGAELNTIAKAFGIDSATALKKLQDELSSIDTPLALEELDIPIIPADPILNSISQHIARADAGTLPVILAHHGFLPQGNPSFALYREMVNGGQVRSVLENTGRPILYLHGHIHEDTLEVIRTATTNHIPANSLGPPIVVISAPPFLDGFNRIDITFSDSTPIGLTVYRFRRERSVLSQLEPTRIPLNSEVALSHDERLVRDVLVDLSHARGDEIISYLIKHSHVMSAQLIQDLLENLIWRGFVRNYGPSDVPFKKRGYEII